MTTPTPLRTPPRTELTERPLVNPSEWCLDPELVFLNHGSFGACPRAILERQGALRLEMERSPVRFNLTRLPALCEAARHAVAPHLGVNPRDVVFVSNASEGVASALDAVEWRAGDEVIISRDGYPACRHMLSDLGERYGVVTRVADTPFGGEVWREAVVSAFEAQISDRTRLILIDHITSPTALVYPVEALVELARSVGAISLVDGAHAPGQLALSLAELQPDLYVGNAHKWMMTPKSCAMLYVSEAWRDRVKPRVISHGYLTEGDARLQALFDWTGTRDYTALACLPETLAWVEAHCGGFEALRARNRSLALAAREVLMSALWGDERSELSPKQSPERSPYLPPDHAIAQLAAVPLPIDLANLSDLADRESVGADELDEPTGSASAGRVHPLQRALWRAGFEVPIIPTAHGVMVRVSAQAYNHLSEYRALADELAQLRSR